MVKHLPREDSQPWYRQFWPWFLILLPASVVVAGLATMVIANRHADDLVADEYYKDGLGINRQLEKKHRAERLGIDARLDFSGRRVSVRTTGPVDAPFLTLLLSHPLESDRDFELTLERVAAGLYQGETSEIVSPRWHWILELPKADGWRLDGSVTAANIDHATEQ